MSKRPRTRRVYTDAFKSQMIELYKAGKSRADIVKEYELTASALDRWIAKANLSQPSGSGQSKASIEAELNRLRKEVKRLQLEVDILKHAALILGRKDGWK